MTYFKSKKIKYVNVAFIMNTTPGQAMLTEPQDVISYMGLGPFDCFLVIHCVVPWSFYRW